MSQKKVLITGAAGFIGFHMAQALHNRGIDVLGLDNFNSYYSVNLKRKRAEILRGDGIDIVEGDLNDAPLLNELFQKSSCTHVLHLAAQAGVRYARTHPQAYISSNISGFLSLLETMRSYPQVKLVYASSSSVYGLNKQIPFSESDRTDSPANLYAVTKKTNELMAYSYCHLYGIRSLGLRFFTVYGPWGRPDMAYYLFTDSIMKGRPISLFNQGKMQRDFTYIDDIVAGTLAALEYPCECEVLNLGNHKPIALLDFVETLEKILGKKAIKVFEKESPGEVEITYADIAESQNKLSFYPSTQLERGLSLFVDWFGRFSSLI